MGVVYKAEDTRLKRTVALKFLAPHILGREEDRTRFIQEAQATAALDHANICTVYEIEEIDKKAFIAMAYVEGQSLREKINSGPLNLDEVLDIAIQAAEGLKEAHDKGVVHRDIKSSNIMVTPKGQAKIMDFGLARLAGRTKLTTTETIMGTVSYMSPEQARCKEVDFRTDIWSLGVVLYEMLTGHTPFKGDHDSAVIYSIINEAPEAVTGLRSGISMDLEWIVCKALEKEKEDRYQNVDELLTDLKRLRTTSVTPGKIQPPPTLERERRKQRLVKISISSGIVVLIILAFLFLRPLLFEEDLVSEPTPITVISFENQTGDNAYDYLQKAIPNLLITNLEQSKYLRVMTWERMEDLLKQMGKEDVEIINKDVGYELCRMDGVNAIVLGSFVRAGDVFATDVKVLDVETKRILKSASAKGRGVGSILKEQIDDLSREISRGVGLSDRKIEATQWRIADATTGSMGAYNYYLRGRENYAKLYYNDARQFLEKAIELDSTFAMAYLELGWAYLELGRTKDRDNAFEKARTFSAKATEKERLYIEAAYAWFSENDPDKGFRILKQMAEQYPVEKKAHYVIARYYRSKKLYPEAIEAFNKAVDLDPNFGRALNSLAYTYAHMGNYAKAIEYFERYASASPGDANPFDSMAEIYFRMGKLDEAIAKYKEALEVKPDFIYALWSIGYVYALKEKYLEAQKWIDQFNVTAPSPEVRAEGFLWKGFYHYWLGSVDQAVSVLRTASDLAEEVRNDFGRAYSDWMTGWIHFDRGELELSRKYFKDWFDFVIEYPSHNIPLPSVPFYTAEYNFYLGLIDLKSGRVDSATSRLTVIKTLLPEIAPIVDDIKTFYNYNILYGEVLLAEDSLEKAITVCEKMAPSDIPYMDNEEILLYNAPFMKDVVARAYQQSGELDKAIAEYERLITFDPNSRERWLIHPIYHYKLAKLYEEQGWPAKAAQEYETFIEIFQDADKDLPELIDARLRLTQLTG